MSAFGRRTSVPTTPNVEKQSGRPFLCVGATMWNKAFPQNFRFPLNRACAAICDDVDRFGELLCLNPDWLVPSYADLRRLGDVISIHDVFIVSNIRFPGPYFDPPAIVRNHIGRSGLIMTERFREALPEHYETRDTEFDCYVMLNDRDEAQVYDHFKDYIFGRPPIFAFAFPAARFVLPQERTIPEGEELVPFACFIPTDEIIMKVY